MKNTKGITLIALIITIIIMLILVSVTVQMLVSSGLFTHADTAVSGYKEEEIREKVGISLSDAMIEQYKNPLEFDLDAYLKSELPEAIISDNMIIVDGWAFEIDRNSFEIVENLGKDGEYDFPTIISIVSNIAEDRKTATITITAEETKNGINKIEIILNGQVIETIDCEGTKSQITKTTGTLTENGRYVIKIYSALSISEVHKIEGLLEMTTDRSILSIGDYIDYIPDIAKTYPITTDKSGYTSDQNIEQEQLKWRVMNVNSDGSVDLISETPTTASIYLQGALGYNNGFKLYIRDKCKKHKFSRYRE